MSSKNHSVFRLVLASMFLALALMMPFLTGRIPQLGRIFLIMHIPVLLCGFFCGPWYGIAVGLIAPLMGFVLTGRPMLIPDAVSMSFELATYGLVCGVLYRATKKRPFGVYVSLIAAMLAGRLVWAAARTVFYGLGKAPFGWAAFLSGAFTQAIPGIILQLVLIPLLVILLPRAVPRLRQL